LPGPCARPVEVPREERDRLKRLIWRRSAPFALVQRARMVDGLARGHSPAEVARRVGCSERNVRKWRARWEVAPRIESLFDADRPGRPRPIPLEVRCKVVQLACDRPDKLFAPFRDVWTQESLADAVRLATGQAISRSTVQRVLSAEGLRPHRVRQWLHSPDPEFDTKVARVCDIYLNTPAEVAVVCVDEKPMQALERKHPDGVGPDGKPRREYEYIRHGTSCLLGAFDIRTGKVLAEVVDERTAEATVAFLEQVAQKYPEGKVIIVWDNLNTHYDGPEKRWSEFNRRHGGRFEFVYTPKHASWMNQIEVWFSILQRRVLRYGSFDSLGALEREVIAYTRHWNRSEAHPFRWTFTGKFTKPSGTVDV
jgi:transposase